MNTLMILNTDYARLLRRWAQLTTKAQRTPAEEAEYKRVRAEVERIELGWSESRLAPAHETQQDEADVLVAIGWAGAVG